MMPIKKKIENVNSKDIIDIIQPIINKIFDKETTKQKLMPLIKEEKFFNDFKKDIATNELTILLNDSKYRLKEYFEVTIFLYKIIKWNKSEKKFDLRVKFKKEDTLVKIFRERKNIILEINYFFKNSDYIYFINQDYNSEKIVLFDDELFLNEILNRVSKYIDIQTKLYDVLNYSSHSSKFRMKLIKLWDVNICPYCNINEIVEYSNASMSTGELDHILPKSYFPLFSLSYGNFMISCSECNMKFKNDSIQYFVYNRMDGFIDKMGFDYKNLTLDSCFNKKNNEIEIILEVQEGSTPIKNSIEDFCLIDRYNSKNSKKEFCKIFREIRRIYNSANVQELSSITGKSENEIIAHMIKYIVGDYSLTEDDIDRIFEEYDPDEAFYIDVSYGQSKYEILNKIGLFK